MTFNNKKINIKIKYINKKNNEVYHFNFKFLIQNNILILLNFNIQILSFFLSNFIEAITGFPLLAGYDQLFTSGSLAISL